MSCPHSVYSSHPGVAEDSLRPSFEDIGPERRKNMQAVRGRNSKPEILVRRLLHRLGYRFRLHASDLPGRPDIVFRGRRKLIEVRGCFWHRHSDAACRNSILPKTRRDWWHAKLSANVQRDARNLDALTRLGWEVLVVWECEVGQPDMTRRLSAFVGDPAAAMKGKRPAREIAFGRQQ